MEKAPPLIKSRPPSPPASPDAATKQSQTNLAHKHKAKQSLPKARVTPKQQQTTNHPNEQSYSPSKQDQLQKTQGGLLATGSNPRNKDHRNPHKDRNNISNLPPIRDKKAPA